MEDQGLVKAVLGPVFLGSGHGCIEHEKEQDLYKNCWEGWLECKLG